MHIEYIKIKNFGKVKEREVHLQDGLVVVRGANRAGKSTTFIQAPLFAFFGISALDSTLDEVVTEGEKTSSLWVEMKYGPYVVKRGKTSAEVKGLDVERSGQDNVTDFFLELFGLSKGTESMVLVSKQGETAGIVNKKPAETLRFIESIAGFDQVEALLEKVKVMYPCGNKEIYEGNIAKNEELREGLATELGEITESQFQKACEVHRITLFKEEADELLPTLQQKVTEAKTKMDSAEHINKSIDAAGEAIAACQKRVKDLVEDITTMQSKVFEVITTEQVKEAQEYLDSAGKEAVRWRDYQTLLRAKPSPDVWDEGEESFLRELKSASDEYLATVTKELELGALIKAKKAQIVKDLVCPVCQTDLGEKVGPINAKLEEEIAASQKYLDGLGPIKQEKFQYLETLKRIAEAQKEAVRLVSSNYLVDKSVVPFLITWKGETPKAPDTAKEKELQGLISRAAIGATQIKNNSENILKSQARLTQEYNEEVKLAADLQSKGQKHDVTLLHSDWIKAKHPVAELEATLQQASKDISKLDSDLAVLTEVLARNAKDEKRIKEEIKTLHESIKRDARNAAIVSEVRKAKPLVLDKVWSSIVILAGERYRLITGEDKPLEKTTRGFKLGPRPMSRLSGAEKTVMGIAFRSTLASIFAPNAGFLFFDEVFDSCDANMAASITAALQGIGGQRIIVTHDSDTELSCDQLIEVE